MLPLFTTFISWMEKLHKYVLRETHTFQKQAVAAAQRFSDYFLKTK